VGGLTTKIHLMAAGDEWAVGFRLSGGNADDAAEGRLLMEEAGPIERPAAVLMDRAYADTKTRLTARGLWFKPVVPPKRNMKYQWEYDKELYKRRDEVERLFRRLTSFRAIATRYDKNDRSFFSSVWFALFLIALNYVNTPQRRYHPAPVGPHRPQKVRGLFHGLDPEVLQRAGGSGAGLAIDGKTARETSSRRTRPPASFLSGA
jgi:transposase